MVTGAAGRGDRGRLAQSAELRSRAGDLHVRGDLRDLGHRLSLRGLAEQAADAPVLRAQRCELFRQRGPAAQRSASSCDDVATHLVGQTFIAKRSRLRWWMHQFLFWGCLLAVAITFPLVFGWIHFGSLRRTIR